MSGMNHQNGKKLSGLDAIKASIANILFTPIGSRVQRREFGSEIPGLIDQPQSKALNLQLMAATVMAITTWEPRVRVLDVKITLDAEKTKILLGVQRLDTASQEVESIAIDR